MIEKFAVVRGKGLSEFLDLNSHGLASVLSMAKFVQF
jgi:hypothetical protein